jgi:hypothetical protein
MQLSTENNIRFGMTFSQGIISYNTSHKKNIFEEIITIQTIEDDKNISEDDKNKLLNLLNSDINPFEKRLRIMRALDKEKDFSSRIGLILKERKNKMKMAEDIMRIFRDYYTKSDVLKKDYGEVLTDFKIVKMMITEIDQEFWKSPYDENGNVKKILDTSNGSGIFLWYVVCKFMKGLSDHFKDEDERYKFIIENMIYACELQKYKMFNWLCTTDLYDEYDLNVFCGSYLSTENGFDKHMKEVWDIEKFTLIISNPPYQELSESGKSKGGGKGGDNNLWSQFIIKSLKICDKLLFINPPSFLSPNHKVLNSMLENGGLSYLHVFDKSPFEGVGTQACFYIWENGYKGETRTSSGNVSLTNGTLPNSSNIKDFVIFDKFFNNDNKKINFIRTCSLHTDNKKKFISKEKNDEFKYELVVGSKILYSSIKSTNHDDIKIIISRSGYLNPTYDDGNKSLSESNYYYIIKDENDKNIINILNSKLYKYCLYKSKFSGFFHGQVLKNIPYISTSVKWDDDLIFKHFNLSEDEISLIEESIKDKIKKK